MWGCAERAEGSCGHWWWVWLSQSKHSHFSSQTATEQRGRDPDTPTDSNIIHRSPTSPLAASKSTPPPTYPTTAIASSTNLHPSPEQRHYPLSSIYSISAALDSPPVRPSARSLARPPASSISSSASRPVSHETVSSTTKQPYPSSSSSRLSFLDRLPQAPPPNPPPLGPTSLPPSPQ